MHPSVRFGVCLQVRLRNDRVFASVCYMLSRAYVLVISSVTKAIYLESVKTCSVTADIFKCKIDTGMEEPIFIH